MDYSLWLKEVPWELSFKSIGYRQEIRSLELMSDTILSVSLSAERLRLETVAITVSREDPAYAIIRKAIERRGDHLEAERDYSVNVYIKSIQRMDDAPEKLRGMDEIGRAT